MVKWGSMLAVVGTLWLGWPLEAQDGFKLIVNPANPVSSVSKAQVSRYFLDRATWDNGEPVAAIDLPSTSPTRELFSKDVLSLPVPSVIARWHNISSAGRGDPPPAMASDREVLAFVRLKPGAIGYVSAATDTQGVKVISIGKSESGGVSQELVEVGGAIPMPERIVSVQPNYPQAAKTQGAEGTVEIEVVIGVTGNIEKATVVRSIPILDNAAIAAVRQWKYKPTAINGVPVQVKARVRVSFAL